MSRSGRAPRRSRVAAAVLGLVLALAPTAAGAAPGTNRSAPPDVVPLLDCTITHPDGSWTAVFGYDNRTGARVEIPVGPANQVTPSGYGRPQPTTFQPGVRRAVFSVTVTSGGGPMWHLGRTNLAARKGTTVCPPSTQMPADGNGTGIVVALVLAGAVGAVVLRRRHSGEPAAA
jgi:MYXO-CTERM domain-containing protein